jgi:hypothetical protein
MEYDTKQASSDAVDCTGTLTSYANVVLLMNRNAPCERVWASCYSLAAVACIGCSVGTVRISNGGSAHDRLGF